MFGRTAHFQAHTKAHDVETLSRLGSIDTLVWCVQPLTLCAFRAYGPFIISVGLMNCLLVVTALSEYPQLSPCITIGSDNGVPLL